MNPEATFHLLAEAAGVHHPNPYRDNRGLCPAHGDRNNPALVFKIGDTGHLVAYCHAQGCTLQQLADSIGVETSAFFAGNHGSRFAKHTPIKWEEQSFLELLKLVPFGYDFDTQVECVFETIEADMSFSTRPLKDILKVELNAIIGIWLAPMYDYNTHGNWWDWHDKTLRTLHALNKDTRTDPAAVVGAIPRRST